VHVASPVRSCASSRVLFSKLRLHASCTHSPLQYSDHTVGPFSAGDAWIATRGVLRAWLFALPASFAITLTEFSPR